MAISLIRPIFAGPASGLISDVYCTSIRDSISMFQDRANMHAAMPAIRCATPAFFRAAAISHFRIKPELAAFRLLVQFQHSATKKTETSEQVLRNLPSLAYALSLSLAIMLIHLAAIEAESSHLYQAAGAGWRVMR